MDGSAVLSDIHWARRGTDFVEGCSTYVLDRLMGYDIYATFNTYFDLRMKAKHDQYQLENRQEDIVN